LVALVCWQQGKARGLLPHQGLHHDHFFCTHKQKLLLQEFIIEGDFMLISYVVETMIIIGVNMVANDNYKKKKKLID
jgi:hypothetical protein